jgi:hypothetical protein
MYSPLIGQFAERDPVDYGAGDENLYRYVANNPIEAVDPKGLAEDRPFRFLNDADYNGLLRDAQRTNPATPGTVAIAVLVESERGQAIGHSAIAVGKPGAGFKPEEMEFYDFGPLDRKDVTITHPVPGARWWGLQTRECDPQTGKWVNMHRDSATGKWTGNYVDKPKLSHVLRDLLNLSKGSNVTILVTQVTPEQAKKIEDYWNRRVFRSDRDKGTVRETRYAYVNLPGTYNCTSAVANSLRASGAFDLPIVSKLTEPLAPANPSLFVKQLRGEGIFVGQALRRTAGNKDRPVDEFAVYTKGDKLIISRMKD